MSELTPHAASWSRRPVAVPLLGVPFADRLRDGRDCRLRPWAEGPPSTDVVGLFVEVGEPDSASRLLGDVFGLPAATVLEDESVLRQAREHAV